MRRLHRILLPLVLLAALAVPARAAEAQTLRGSRSSIDRMYRQAKAHDLYFYKTGRGVRRAADRGDLVRMSGNSDYRVGSVTYPYVLPTTRTFVQRLAAQYRGHCGEKLVVTSGVRPTSFRLLNSADRSVHPTGMAIDLRKPAKRRCLTWLRETLVYLEAAGTLEATEEHRPPHFHVAVYPGPYRRYVARNTGRSGGGEERTAARSSTTKRAAPARATYRVRQGDTLWAIARRHGTSVERLKDANDIRSNRIRPGQVLIIPTR